MKKDLAISFYSLLYGILFIVGVHYWSFILTNLLQFILLGYVVDFDYIPYVRLVILFFEIIFISKYLKKLVQENYFNQKMFFSVFILCLSGALIWLLLDYFNIEARPILCAHSFMEEGWEENIYGENIRSAYRVNIIEQLVIIVSIFIYSFFRIKEMLVENIEE